MLQVRDVVKSFDGRTVVNRVSFQVGAGEIFALLGPNGAGKTTLIRMITDILKPDAGEVVLEGRTAGHRAPHLVGYLPEERGLYRRSGVLEIVRFYGELKGLSRRDASQSALSLLERVGLGEWAGKQVQALSKGMQQKVQICTALIGDPRLLILDEPFSGLDPVNVRLLEDILQDTRTRGTTVLLSTHQMNKVEELCDRALMMNHGFMVLYGTVHEFRRRYSDHAVVVRTHGVVPAVPGVKTVESTNGDHKLVLEPDATPQSVLRALLNHGLDIESFTIATLPLEDVFVKVVQEGLGLDHGRSEPVPPPAPVGAAAAP